MFDTHINLRSVPDSNSKHKYVQATILQRGGESYEYGYSISLKQSYSVVVDSCVMYIHFAMQAYSLCERWRHLSKF